MIKNWDKVKVYDLTQNTSILTPPWQTYEPLQVKFFKRLSPNGANGMYITTSNHVGTHLDGPLHFDTAGRDIASLEMDKLMGPGVVDDISDISEDWSIYTPQDIMDRVEVKPGDILYINTGYHRYGFDQPEANERRYMLRHPGPSMDFIPWIKEMKFKHIAVNCGSADHPMNTKIRDWETTLALFQDEYKVPLLSPGVAAVMGTGGELVLPVLLLFGLGGRFAALGLSVMNVVAVISLSEIAPAALQQHVTWGVLLAALAIFGVGRWSLDGTLLKPWLRRWGLSTPNG